MKNTSNMHLPGNQRYGKDTQNLVERRFIGYWGTNYCEATGHKAWYLYVRDSKLKYTPIKSNSHAR
jgi:hypothetical protein